MGTFRSRFNRWWTEWILLIGKVVTQFKNQLNEGVQSKCSGGVSQTKGVVFYLLQRSGRGSEVIRSVGEGTVFRLQGAALRVVVVKPAGTSFQSTGGNGFPLGIRPGGLPVPPVSYVHPPSFHWKRGNDRKIQDLFRIKCQKLQINLFVSSSEVEELFQGSRSKQPVCFMHTMDNNRWLAVAYST